MQFALIRMDRDEPLLDWSRWEFGTEKLEAGDLLIWFGPWHLALRWG